MRHSVAMAVRLPPKPGAVTRMSTQGGDRGTCPRIHTQSVGHQDGLSSPAGSTSKFITVLGSASDKLQPLGVALHIPPGALFQEGRGQHPQVKAPQPGCPLGWGTVPGGGAWSLGRPPRGLPHLFGPSRPHSNGPSSTFTSRPRTILTGHRWPSQAPALCSRARPT